jgi:hypothetical protein
MFPLRRLMAFSSYSVVTLAFQRDATLDVTLFSATKGL